MPDSTTGTPHDALFKIFLGHPDMARDFLVAHLPQSLRRSLDLHSLKLMPGSFVEEDLRSSFSDILYQARTPQGDGYVYVLIEHQSSPDKHIAFRLLRYALAAMQRHLESGHSSLPVVIPLLFYHGQVSPWPHPLCWLDLFADRELACRLYTGDFPLVDLTVIPDATLLQHKRVAVVELLQKHIRQRDLMELVDSVACLLATYAIPERQLRALLHYMVRVGKCATPAAFMRQLASRTPQHRETLMTIAEYLEAKGKRLGRFEGRKEGRKEGREEGERAEALRIARRMQQNGLSLSLIVELTGINPDGATSA